MAKRMILRSDGKCKILRSGASYSSGEPKKRKISKRAPVLDEKSGERIAGVWAARTAGKYWSQIYDPAKKKWIWLGTFDSIQKASEVYNAKRREMESVERKEECGPKSRDLRKEIVSVESNEYNGGGATGFMIPVSGGSERVFLPVIDNFGFLIGSFSEGDISILDDWLSKVV